MQSNPDPPPSRTLRARFGMPQRLAGCTATLASMSAPRWLSPCAKVSHLRRVMGHARDTSSVSHAFATRKRGMARLLRWALAISTRGLDINDARTPLIEPSMAGVIKQFGPSYLTCFDRSIPASHFQAMMAIERCRTPALGGQVLQCSSCKVQDYAYHSCRHRSCPRCMAQEGAQWFEARVSELLPVPYFHVVFEVPTELHRIIRAHKRTLYPVLMSAAAGALQQVGADPKYFGGTIGVMATLHTWSRTLIYHPHVHCLVPAGAIDEQGRWQAAKRANLAPEELLAKLFQAELCRMANAAIKGLQLSGSNLGSGWKVYVDTPKHGTETVLRYLSRSLYRGPLSDHDIVEVTDHDVTFQYRDRDRRNVRTMRLGGHEFLRRFLQHVWPDRIHKVRYFGLWSRKCRPQLEALRQQLLAAAPVPAPAEVSVAGNAVAPLPNLPSWLKCPHCSGQRVVLCDFGPGRSPPPLPIRLPNLAAPPPAGQPP